MTGNGTPGNFQDGYLIAGQALGNLPQNIVLNADDLVLNPRLTPFLRIVSDNATATSRSFSLFAGSYMGQIIYLTLVPTTAGVSTGKAELLSTGNVSLTGGTWTASVGDTLQLMWDGTSGLWREIARASASEILLAGTYTPTFTAGTNVATATAGLAHYQRIGTQIFVSGTGSIASTAATNTASAFTVSLPVASDLAAAGDLTGSGAILSATSVVSAPVIIVAETTANTATFSYNAAQTAAGTLGYSFAYTVI